MRPILKQKKNLNTSSIEYMKPKDWLKSIDMIFYLLQI